MWWDELTLNEVRVENMIYQKEYDITQSCIKKYTRGDQTLLQATCVYIRFSQTLDKGEERRIV